MLAGGAHAAAPTGNFGTHGMALFGGKDALYTSHLPMFHAPHDFQVILQVHLADPRLDAELRARMDGKTALWTVDPEKFALDRLAPDAAEPLRQFKADLVLGHFERGGAAQYRGAAVVVDKVLVYRRLDPSAKANGQARYMQFGAGRQRFLVKEIDSRPDFDHIVAIAAPPASAADAASVAKAGLDEPSAAAFKRALPRVEILGTVYFDTADLK